MFLSIVITLAGTYVLIKSDRTLGSLLFLVGIILVLTYYGLRWFSEDSFKFTKLSAKQWPPVMNLCPDFLTYTRRTDTGTKVVNVCVDMIGVSQNGIQKFKDNSNLQNENYIFNLFEDEKSTVERYKKLCEECKRKKVTWEGIYDGVSCLTPSGANLGPGAGGSDQCP
jgi:hypothetical protein